MEVGTGFELDPRQRAFGQAHRWQSEPSLVTPLDAPSASAVGVEAVAEGHELRLVGRTGDETGAAGGDHAISLGVRAVVRREVRAVLDTDRTLARAGRDVQLDGASEVCVEPVPQDPRRLLIGHEGSIGRAADDDESVAESLDEPTQRRSQPRVGIDDPSGIRCASWYFV